MRSRYSAFAKGLTDHVLRTWHPTTRPASIDAEPSLTWTGLQVVATTAGGPDDQTGQVEFVASYEAPTGPGRLHEVSRFERVDGRWVYVDGEVR